MTRETGGPGQVGPPSAEAQLETAHQRLASLGVQVDVMQATLVRLLQDVVRAEARLADHRTTQLVEANENLVLALLASQQDPLTQLPNRVLLADRFLQCKAQARRQGQTFALLFVDLDGFKRLNDAHGHAFGDEVLRWVSSRLVASVREVDTVSRHGGDEFVILLADLVQQADVDAVVAKLKASLAGPVTLSGHEVLLSASIGVAHYPADGEDLDTLLRCADAAMYRGKHAGGRPATPPPGAGPPPGHKADADADQAPAKADDDARQTRLREANEQLLLATLSARELVEAADAARRQQGEVLAAVTEELRNPAAPIRIASAMLGRDDDAAPLLPRVQQIIETQVRRMASLVADLVEASQRTPPVLAPERRPVDMAVVVADAVQGQGGQFASRSQQLGVHLPPAPAAPSPDRPARPVGPFVAGDAARLAQVVDNLLDNASRHTSDGGRIRVDLSADDATVTLVVSDQGIGITAEMLPHVFEPFLLDTHALGADGPGLGIGLTVVRALVQAQGGEITVHSAGKGRGSRFVVTWPRAAAPEEAADGR